MTGSRASAARLSTAAEQAALNDAAKSYVDAIRTMIERIYGEEQIRNLESDALAAVLMQQAMTGVFNAMPPDSGFGARFTGIGLGVGSFIAQVEPDQREFLRLSFHRGLNHALAEHEPLFTPQGTA